MIGVFNWIGTGLGKFYFGTSSIQICQSDTRGYQLARLSWSSPPPSVKWWNFVLHLIKHIAVNRPNWFRWRIWDENKTKQRSHLFAGKYNLQGPEHDSEIKSRIQVHSLSFPWLETNNHEFVFIFIVFLLKFSSFFTCSPGMLLLYQGKF